jgi:hypothetical protein
MIRSTSTLCAALLLCGCASKPDEKNADTTPTPTPTGDPAACVRQLIPPTGYQQETAFEPESTPNALEVAQERAKLKLRDRLCQGHRCEEIAPQIKGWEPRQGGGIVCVMAVVRDSEVSEFLRTEQDRFDEALRSSAKGIVERVAKQSGQKVPVFAIDVVRDRGVPGGVLAEWVVDRTRQALSATGATLSRLPPGWGGASLPGGVQGVLRGKITAVRSARGQDVMFEIHWDVLHGENAEFSPAAVQFPQQIGPAIDPATRMPEPEDTRLLKQDQIALHIADAREGGGLCDGQQAELFVETKQPLYVRVLGVSGDAEVGMMLWASDGLVQPGKPVSLGQFLVMGTTRVPVERFVVIAAPTTEGLGPYAPARDACKLPVPTTAELHRGVGIPTGPRAYAYSTGYRIMRGKECEGQPQATQADIAQARAYIDSLSLCPGM